MHNIQFVPECYAETEMVKQILFIENVDYLNHAGGIQEVSRILKKRDMKGYLNIGFIDKDKYNTPPYFDGFEIIEDHNLVSFKKHPNTNDYLFIAKPAIEKFIFKQLVEIEKSPSDYDLPNDFIGFCKKLKKIRIQYDEGYKNMISDLRDSKTSGITFIINKITDLRSRL